MAKRAQLSRHVTKSFLSLSTFEYLIYSCDYGSIKPELAIYRNCLELLKAAPQDILYLDDRNLGFEDSCLSGAPPPFSGRFGQVVDDGRNRFRSRHACRWMAHSQVRQSEHRDWVDIGLWPRTALDCRIQYGPNTVGRSSFLWGDGWFDGCSDEYSRRDAREAIPASHHVVISRPLQLGWNGRFCVRGIGR